MFPRLLMLVALPLALAGCGTSETSETTPAQPSATASPPQPAPPGSMAVTAYFLRGGEVAPVRLHVPPSRAVATAALRALLDGPPAGYETAIPEGTKLDALTIDAGVAHPRLEGDLADGAARAQLVYTLTQFPSVTGVALPGSSEPLTREEFEELTPRILVETPLPRDRVTSPLRVAGTSNNYEATFQLELVQNGKTLVSTFVTATSGNGIRGTFEQELTFDGSGPATLVAYERNAAGEGPPELGRVEIPVVLD